MKLNVSWPANPAADQVTGYNVAITYLGSPISGSPFSVPATASPSLTRTGLASGVHAVTVQAVSPSGVSSPTTPVSSPGAPTTPGAPTVTIEAD